MTFEQQILSTFIGATAGFIFSIVLYYLTEKIKQTKTNKDLSFNLEKELECNISFLQKILSNFGEIKEKILADDKPIIASFELDKIQRLFLMEAFNKGKLYKNLNSDEISMLDSMLNYFTRPMNGILYDSVQQFNANKTTKQRFLFEINFNIKQLNTYYDFIKMLKIKLKKIK